MDGFTRRKEQSKEDIRKAAWDLFSQFGVDKVSIADISRKANVSQATIYNNFGSKEALIREFVTSAVEHLVARVQAILVPDQQYREKMTAFIQFISEIMIADRPIGADSAIFKSSLDLQNDPEIKKIRLEAKTRMTDLLMGLIEEGKMQGQVKANLSEEVLEIYLAIYMDVFTNPELQIRFYHRPNLVKELGLLMLNGLRGE